MNEMGVIAPVHKIVRVKARLRMPSGFTGGLTRWWPSRSRRRQETDSEGLDGAAAWRAWLEISEDGTETSVATIIGLGAAASSGDALAGQRAVET